MEIKKETVQNYLYPELREQWKILFGTDTEIQLHKWLVKYKSDCLFLYNVHGMLNDESSDIIGKATDLSTNKRETLLFELNRR
ncbi:hypothetical protein HCA06_14680 [Listeria welshimeri]|nr:hypothetical protein [Listeria welshimeri]